MFRLVNICSSVFLVFVLTRPGYADEHFPFLAEVSKESVNVRAGPNTNFEKVDKLSKHSKVVVLGRSYEWFKVQPLPTTKAFIRSDYLDIKGEGVLAIVLGENVNVRCRPSSDAASLGQVKKGTLVKVLEKTQGWCRLDVVEGTAAWIHQDFLRKVSEEVPSSMMITKLERSSSPVVSEISKNVPETRPEKIVIENVTLQGKLQALVMAPSEDIHYKIMIDEKTVYYLKDVPQMSFFANAVVSVEGSVIEDPLKKYIYPVVHITKIALVL